MRRAWLISAAILAPATALAAGLGDSRPGDFRARADFSSLRIDPRAAIPTFYMVDGDKWNIVVLPPPAPPSPLPGSCPAVYPAPQAGSTGIGTVPTTLTGGTAGSPAKFHLTTALITATGSEDAIVFPKTGSNRGYVILDLRGFDIEGFGNGTGGGVNPNGWYIYSSAESVLRPGDCPEWRANGATVINIDSNLSFAFADQSIFEAFRVFNYSTATSTIKRGLLWSFYNTGAEPSTNTLLLRNMEGEVTATSSTREIAFDFVNTPRVTVQGSQVTCGTGNVEGSGIAAFNQNYLTVTDTTILGQCRSRSIIQDHLSGAIGSINRASSIVTVNTTKPHRAYVGAPGRLQNCTPTSFNGFHFTISSIVDNDTFTFTQAGIDESASCTGSNAWEIMSRGANLNNFTADVGLGRCARLRGVRDFTIENATCSNITNTASGAIDLDQCGSGYACSNGDLGSSFIRNVTFGMAGGTAIFVRGTNGNDPGTHGGVQIIDPIVSGTSGRFMRLDTIFGINGEATIENITGGTALSIASSIQQTGGGTGTLNLCPTGSLNTTGSGTVVPYDTCTGPAQPELTITPSASGFPDTVLGQLSPTVVTIQIENSGGALLTFAGAGVAKSGADAAMFGLADDCGATLAAGASCTATVTFTPTAPVSPPAKAVSIDVTSDAVVCSPVACSVPLTGNGTQQTPAPPSFPGPAVRPVLMVSLAADAPPRLTLTNPDPVAAPFCATATENDCIFEARILVGSSVVQTVPASAFTNGVATVDFTGGPRFGNITVTARLAARAFDGALIESDDSDPVIVPKKPPKLTVKT